MAHLVRQQKTYYVDAGGRRIPKGTKGARKVREKSSKWYGVGIPGLPPKKRVPLATDKGVARKMLADLVEKGERGVAAMPVRGEAGRPLEPLVAEFGEAVGWKSAPKHTRDVLKNVRHVLAGCRLATLADLRADEVAAKVERYVWSLTAGDDPLAGATAAYVGKHARQFTRWLWRKRKLLDHDPLAGVDLPSQETTTRRRALAAEELARLIGAAEANPKPFRFLAGPDRAVLYLTAVATGYRSGELARLTPTQFDLDAEVPIVRLSGRLTKNKKHAEQPIPPAVAARLRAYLAGRPSDRPVWPGSWPDRAADMLRADLAAAGLPDVIDDEEAVFHSLRHSYTTLLAAVAPVKVTQELARHSTPVLTFGRYTHAGMVEKAAAVALLPLPGSVVAAGPFAGLSRADLERTAEALLAGMIGLLASSVVTPGVTPDLATAGDSGRRPGTPKRDRRAAEQQRCP